MRSVRETIFAVEKYYVFLCACACACVCVRVCVGKCGERVREGACTHVALLKHKMQGINVAFLGVSGNMIGESLTIGHNHFYSRYFRVITHNHLTL